MVATVLSSPSYAVILLLLAGATHLEVISGFQLPVTKLSNSGNQRCNVISSASSSVAINMAINEKDTADSLFGPRVDDGEDVVLYADDDVGSDGGEAWGAPSEPSDAKRKISNMTRWGSLNPKIKGMQKQ